MGVDQVGPGEVTSSLPDDTFFILAKSLKYAFLFRSCSSFLDLVLHVCVCVCVLLPVLTCVLYFHAFFRRAFASCNTDGACAMINNAR